jgi:hypothetical protein
MKNQSINILLINMLEEKLAKAESLGMTEAYISGFEDALNILKSELSAKCVYCSDGKLKPIVYGYPSGDLLANPNVILGGCTITSDDPEYACSDCGSYFWVDGRSERF